MNLINLSARRNREALLEEAADSSSEKKTRTLQDLSRDELLAEVSPEESLDTLVKGEISPEPLMEKAKTFAADYRDKKHIEPPDVRDLERRIARLEALVNVPGTVV